MTQPVYTEITASISELKKNPMAVVNAGEGFPIAVLNRNKPAFYCVPADVYEAILERLNDHELTRLVESRRAEPAQLKGSRNRKESAKVGSGLRVNSENREWDFVVVN